MIRFNPKKLHKVKSHKLDIYTIYKVEHYPDGSASQYAYTFNFKEMSCRIKERELNFS